MWSRRRYFYCYSENPVVLYFLLRFIILITLGNRHKVFLLNENHKFSVEILKPRASSKKFLDYDQPPRLGDIVSCALHTRKEIWERSRPISTKLTGSDGLRTFLKVFGVVMLSRLSVASWSHMYASLTTVIFWPFSSFFQTVNDQAKKGISASRNSTQQKNFYENV